MPLRTQRSRWFIPIAERRTRASSARSGFSGRSSGTRRSGPPCSWIRIAFKVRLLGRVGENAPQSRQRARARQDARRRKSGTGSKELRPLASEQGEEFVVVPRFHEPRAGRHAFQDEEGFALAVGRVVLADDKIAVLLKLAEEILDSPDERLPGEVIIVEKVATLDELEPNPARSCEDVQRLDPGVERPKQGVSDFHPAASYPALAGRALSIDVKEERAHSPVDGFAVGVQDLAPQRPAADQEEGEPIEEPDLDARELLQKPQRRRSVRGAHVAEDRKSVV